VIIAGNLLNCADAAVIDFEIRIPLGVENGPAFGLVLPTLESTPAPTATSSTPIKVLQGGVQVTSTPIPVPMSSINVGGGVCFDREPITWVPVSTSPVTDVEGNACFLLNGRIFCKFEPSDNELLSSLFLLAEHENGISMDEFCPLQEIRCRLMGNDPDMRDLVRYLGQQIDEGEWIIHAGGISESALGENNPIVDTIIAKLGLCGARRGREYYIARIPGTLEMEGGSEEIEEGDIVRKDLIPNIKLKELPIPPQIRFAIEPIIVFDDMVAEYMMEYEELRRNPTLAIEKVRRLFSQVARKNGPYKLVRKSLTLQVGDREIVVKPGNLVQRNLLQALPSPSPFRHWWGRAWNAMRFWRR
jgi:hypothetical protein